MKKVFANLSRLLAGSVVGNAAGGALWWAFSSVAFVPNTLEVLVIPSLFLLPMIIGAVAMWVWKPLQLGYGGTILNCLHCTAFGLCGAALLLGEGAICLIIASPLFYLAVLAGALFQRAFMDHSDKNLRLSVLPLLVGTVIAEPFLRGSHTGVVTDKLLIAAPPEKVWPHVLAFPAIADPPQYWLFKLGLPYPIATTNEGNFVGAARACIFSGNAVFEERVVELERHHSLTFDIIKCPPDPELLGHLDPFRGQFELVDHHDGTTTLIGRTWYSLHVRPAWYFDEWTHSIFRAVHLRVMLHIQRLSEDGTKGL